MDTNKTHAEHETHDRTINRTNISKAQRPHIYTPPIVRRKENPTEK